MEDYGLPEYPKIDESLMQECRERGNYSAVLFEWYQFVGALCNFVARLQPDSPDMRKIPPLHYAFLRGLLNRCSRLMLANTALSQHGMFGEATAIIDRSIFESAVKLMWLCAKNDDASFQQLVLGGLKSEVTHKSEI